MNLPIRFPSETEVILEDVARFRSLSRAEQLRSLGSLLRAGDVIIQASPKADFARTYAEEQELAARKATREFFARHGF
ncbi:MAG: hypothetical protein ACYC61_15035 [Isosphaeraceae bacterium]